MLVYPFLRTKAKMREVRLPNLVGIGSSRCGTSNLFGLLQASSDVYIAPVKEANYFGVSDLATGAGPMSLREYQILFAAQECERYIAEVTPIYLTIPKSIDQIRKVLGDIKIIVNLRNPFDRMMSHFSYHKTIHGESSFSAYVAKAVQQHRENPGNRLAWNAPQQGILHSLYAPALEQVRSLFSERNVLVLMYDDVHNSETWASQLSDFLGVEIAPTASGRFQNKSEGGKIDLPDSGDIACIKQWFEQDLMRLKAIGIPVPDAWFERSSG